MKKVLAFITALTALFCTACDNKQDNISDNPPVGDVTSAVAEADVSENTGENTETADVSDGNSDSPVSDTELKHYTLADFKEIKVNLNVQETAPPVEFKEYDLSGIEFEAKKSPCKLPENVKIENICPDSENTAKRLRMEHKEYCQKFMESYAPVLESEDKPLILQTAFDGKNLYYLVDYDTACPLVSHNFEIFRYNPETEENVSIYEYSDGTVGFDIPITMYFDNGLQFYVLNYPENSPSISGYILDESSSSINKISEREIPIDNYVRDLSSYKSVPIDFNYTIADIQLENENRKVIAYTDKIKLETDINNCTAILSTDKRMCFLQADGDVSILHTFDFEKMEKYTTHFESSDATRAYQLGNNVLVHYVYNQKCMYFIPELGAGFVLQDVERLTSPLGTNYYANNSSVSQYGNKLALTNFYTGRHSSFYFDYTTLKDIEYTPIENDPLQKLYIFEAE